MSKEDVLAPKIWAMNEPILFPAMRGNLKYEEIGRF